MDRDFSRCALMAKNDRPPLSDQLLLVKSGRRSWSKGMCMCDDAGWRRRKWSGDPNGTQRKTDLSVNTACPL